MRTSEQISKIKSNISDPCLVKDFLSAGDIKHLLDIFETAEEKNAPLIYKNTGPITLDLKSYMNDNVIKSILDKIEIQIGKYEVTSAFFFKTNYPHIIHNDDSFELPDNVYKGITLPLCLYGDDIKNYPSLCFFNQFYFHGPSKFFKDETYVPTYYNKQVYDYNDIEQLTDKKFDDQIYQKYFTHIKKTWLDGLTFHSAIDWIPGSAIIFDSVRLHCASDFRKQNIKEKTAISIFTKKK